jgi:hypothetical protein
MFSLVRACAILAVIVSFAVSAAAQQAGSALLAQAVAATQAARADYAFDFELETTKQNWRARYEPAASPRLTLVQPRRDELERDERRAFDRMAEQMEGVSRCASENIGRVEELRHIREDETSAVYAFQPTPESIRGEQARRFADRLRGEMTILKNEADISRVRLHIPAAFSPLPLVRVDHVNIVISCHAAPNGRRFAAETVTQLRGSAFGQAFDERSVQRMRNLGPG